MSSWFRAWHGAPSDTKLALVARGAKVPRAIVTAIWWEILDYASQNKPRGSIDGIDWEVIAYQQDIDVTQCHAVSHELHIRNMICDGVLTGWKKRQPEREDETAKGRKRRQRDKEKDNKNQTQITISRNVTQRHAPDTEAEAETELETDTSSLRSEVQQHAPEKVKDDFGMLAQKVQEIIAAPVPMHMSRIRDWVAWGASPAIIAATVTTVMERERSKGKMPSSLTYFDNAVKQAIHDANHPVKEPSHDTRSSPNTRAKHPARIDDQDYTAGTEGFIVVGSGRPKTGAVAASV